MASLIWLKTKEKPYITPFERAFLLSIDDLSPLSLRGLNAPRYIIAKGNIVAGVEAKY